MLQLARAALKPLAAASDLVIRPPAGVTILIYHRVGAGSGSQVDLDPAVFDQQMAELAQSGRVLSLDDAVAALDGGHGGPDDAVVVTFDDGTPDVVEVALPILERHRIPMTLYVATSFVGADVGFWRPEDRAITWDALGEAVSTGLVTIGSHTHSHALLDRLPDDQLADELDRSVDLIGHHLGLAPDHFAYPKALPPSPAADAAVRARFRSAAIAGTRPNPWQGADVHLLTRAPVQRSDGMAWFRRKAAGGLGLEDRLREVVNRRRYAEAVR